MDSSGDSNRFKTLRAAARLRRCRRDGVNGQDTGLVRVFSGSDGNIVYSIEGDTAFGQLGTSVSGVGDVWAGDSATVTVGDAVVVPEPSVAAMLILAFAGITLRRNKHQLN